MNFSKPSTPTRKRSSSTHASRGLPSMSRSLKYAWWFENFRKQLATGAFRFSYFKKDGSIREAVGTLDFGLIPTEHLPKGTADSETSEVSTFAYYDLEKGSWRSFCLDNFIGFVEEVK